MLPQRWATATYCGAQVWLVLSNGAGIELIKGFAMRSQSPCFVRLVAMRLVSILKSTPFAVALHRSAIPAFGDCIGKRRQNLRLTLQTWTSAGSP